MAVYFQPQYKPWWSDLAGTALSSLLKGMFERDAAARTKNQFNKQWGQLQDSFGGGDYEPAAGLIIQGAPQQNAFGAEPFGGIPEAFRPQEGDGLLATARKAQYNTGARIPTRAQAFANVGRFMAPENIDAARKLLEDQYGGEFKMQDADRLSDRLGPTPQYNDRQGTLGYMSKRALYDPDGAKTMSGLIQHLNPGFKNSTVNLGNRQVVLSQDPYTGETTPVFSGAVSLSPDTAYSQAQANARQKMALEAALARGANDYREARDEQKGVQNLWEKAGDLAAQFKGDPEGFAQAVRSIDPTMTPESVAYVLDALKARPQIMDSRTRMLVENPLYGYDPASNPAPEAQPVVPAQQPALADPDVSPLERFAPNEEEIADVMAHVKGATREEIIKKLTRLNMERDRNRSGT